MDKIASTLNRLGYKKVMDGGDRNALVIYGKDDVVVELYSNTHSVLIKGKHVLRGFTSISTHRDRLINYLKLINRKEVIRKILD